jgi:pectate lyase
MATIVVNSTAGLSSALNSAQGGDVIQLASGVYSDLSLKGLTFASNVTITSADAAKPAVITDFVIRDVSGLTFKNVELATPNSVETKGGAYWAFNVFDSREIHFDQVSVHGSLDGDSSNDVQGLNFLDSSHISITNSEFQQLERAMSIGRTDHVHVTGNYVHDLRSDGFDFAQVSYVQVSGNTFTNFTPAEGDHPDAIQFWTRGTTEPSHDIVISGNAILRGEGSYTQGIFFRDQTDQMPFERVTISDNLIVNTGYNAIRVTGIKDLTVTDNTLVSVSGQNKTWMLIQKADGVVASGNSATSIGFDDVSNLTDAGNTITKSVTDLGADAIKTWMEANPATAALVGAGITGLLPIDYFPPTTDDAILSIAPFLETEPEDWTDGMLIDPNSILGDFNYIIS